MTESRLSSHVADTLSKMGKIGRKSLTSAEAAAMIGCSIDTVQRLVDRGTLRGTRLTPRSPRRISAASVLELVASSHERVTA